MAQLKLNLSETDADEIRRLASERGMGISAFVRDQILGTMETELAPHSVLRLDAMHEALSSLVARVEDLEASTDLDPLYERTDALERRLSQIEELAQR